MNSSVHSQEQTPRLSEATLGTLACLHDERSRTEFFADHGDLIHEAVVAQLAEAVRTRVHVDAGEAAALSEAAVVVARGVGGQDAMAYALRARANAHRFKNEFKMAADLFKQAATRFERSGNQVELARTLSSSIKASILLGDYASALDAAERGRKIFAALGDERGLARLEINTANILHRQDRFAEALARYEQALTHLLPIEDVEGIGVALHNMAVCLIVLNDGERARATYERARAHCAAAGMKALVAQADYNIAYLHYFRGDYSRALEMLRTTRVACTQAGDLYHAALCSLDQAEIYLELNLSAEAEEMASEAQSVFERLGNGYEGARALASRAIALGQQGEGSRAIELFARARTTFERERNVGWPSAIDLYQALVLVNDERYLEARRLALAALDSFRVAGLQRKVVSCELLLARIALRIGMLGDAAFHCRSAILQCARLAAPVLAYQAHFLMGEIDEASGRRAEAYASYRTARGNLESLRGILWGEDLKIAFMTTKAAVYERLVDLCLPRGDEAADEIFGYVEEAKSRSLRDLFFERVRPMPSSEAAGSEASRRIRSLREELNWFYHRIEHEELNTDARSAGRLDSMQEQLLRREHAFLRVVRETPSGELASMGIPDPTAATAQSIRASLAPGTTLVEYFRTGDQILAVVLTLDDLRVVPVASASRVRHLLRRLQFQLSKFLLEPKYLARVGPLALEATQAHLQELHGELLAPLQLKPGGHVVVVPHDILHYVPFHALFDGQAYVADTTEVSYAPSASIYSLCCQRPVPAGHRSLVFGVPDARAPFIVDEVQAVARLVPHPEVRLGADASVATLRTLGPGNRIVHIATHGRFREDNPLFSSVRLGDSYLTMHDLASLQLPVDLVTLSGCGTGLNAVADGDELRGLVRGFLAAGARSLLVSLWDVHDRSTAEFMTFFYGGLEAGLNKAAALRAAAAQLRREYDHPYYWAPFVLVGAA